MTSARNILLDALNDISSFFAQIAGKFWGMAFMIYGVPWVGQLSQHFDHVADFFGEISWFFIILRDSLLRIYDKAEEILTWDYIWQEITVRLPDLSLVAEWVEHAYEMITGIINFWWDYMSVTVHGWIEEAFQAIGDIWELIKGNVEALITQAVQFIGDTIATIWARLSDLETSWSYFITVTLPSLPNLTVVEDLISSWFRNYEPFWAGWQEWKDQVVEFFTDPEDWLYKAADRIIERFW